MMKHSRLVGALRVSLVASAIACGTSSGGTGTSLAIVAVHPWDGGAEAGCSIGSGGVKVGCATIYPITGNPSACAGFDEAGAGITATCQAVCMSGLTCQLAGLSDGENVVDCTATCASPEH